MKSRICTMPRWALENGILILWCLKKAEFCAVPQFLQMAADFQFSASTLFCCHFFPLLLLPSFLLFAFSLILAFFLLVNLKTTHFFLTSLLNTRDRNSAQTFVFSAWNSPVNSTWWFFYFRGVGIVFKKKTLNLISQLAFVIWNNSLQTN